MLLNQFNPNEMGTFIDVMAFLLRSPTVIYSGVDVDKAFAAFKAVLLNVSIHQPPHSQRVFSVRQVELIGDFVVNTYVSGNIRITLIKTL
jgi:hypothetical protein